MALPVVAAFCMSGRGHLQRLHPVVAHLRQRGVAVHVFTDSAFAADVRAMGARFEDLFASATVDAIDGASWPPACRYVSFAGHAATDVIARVAALRPTLVLHDTFAVIGPVVGRALGVPFVNLCAGHRVLASAFVPMIEAHPKLHVSAACLAAVDRLRSERGMMEASPFAYVTNTSPYLNLYGEPPEFLDEAARPFFEPLAFFGSLLDDGVPSAAQAPHRASVAGGRWDVYVAFGTIVWHHRDREALGTVSAIADWSRAHRRRVLVSLGGFHVPADQLRRFADCGVVVEPYVDQQAALATADAFVTHHGLNSTHEAVAARVPMISYPFIWDQPGQAANCQRLGLAVPLTATVMGEVSVTDVAAACDAIASGREAMAAALERARDWERAVIAGRPAVIDRVLALAEGERVPTG